VAYAHLAIHLLCDVRRRIFKGVRSVAIKLVTVGMSGHRSRKAE